MVALLTLLFLLPSLALGSPSVGCGGPMPQQPNPGNSHASSILVDDPNLGSVERTFVLHLPAGYSSGNDVPTPLVLDFHGWGGNGQSQEYRGGLDDVANDDEDGGFIVVHGDGFGDPSSGRNWGSWNCSRTDGPSGPPCVLPRPEGFEIHCYESCGQCDPVDSCDWTACYDDIVFVRALFDHVKKTYCVEEDSVHLTGISNGGMFVYYAASRLNDVVASIAPASGSPLIGFGNVPTDPPVSLIDFHGLLDGTIQYDLTSPGANGVGPDFSVVSWDYYYYEQKPSHIAKWVEESGCAPDGQPYPTDMDGVDGWSCSLWTSCDSGTEAVHCTGLYPHDYPFANQSPAYIGGSRILWEFMKTHRRN